MAKNRKMSGAERAFWEADLLMRVSPETYAPELAHAQAVRRLANWLGLLELSTSEGIVDGYDFEGDGMQQLLADVAAVREEYGLDPEAVQLALQACMNEA